MIALLSVALAGTAEFSPDGTQLATCMGPVLRIWNAEGELQHRMLSVDCERIRWAPDGSSLTVGSKFYGSKHWQPHAPPVDLLPGLHAPFSSGGLASCVEGSLTIGGKRRDLDCDELWMGPGDLVYVHKGKTVTTFDESGRVVAKLKAGEDLAFQPYVEPLLFAGDDRSMWDMTTGERIWSITYEPSPPHRKHVNSIAGRTFFGDNRCLWGVSGERTWRDCRDLAPGYYSFNTDTLRAYGESSVDDGWPMILKRPSGRVALIDPDPYGVSALLAQDVDELTTEHMVQLATAETLDQSMVVLSAEILPAGSTTLSIPDADDPGQLTLISRGPVRIPIEADVATFGAWTKAVVELSYFASTLTVEADAELVVVRGVRSE